MSILDAGLAASLPAVCGLIGGVSGSLFSDLLLRRGWSLTATRKMPIVLGMLLSLTTVICNFIDLQWLIVFIMAVSFLGESFGPLGWAVLSDTAAKEIAGLSGALFNMLGNLSSTTTPIIIGLIVQNTGSFDAALVFIGANALVVVVTILMVVGEIERVVLKKPATAE